MIIDINGSMFKLAPAGSLVGIPVNTVGVTGKGLAKYMEVRWPEARSHYWRECKRGRMSVGELKTFVTDDYHLAFVPTKFYWGNPSTVVQINDSLARLSDYMTVNGIKECHISELGCGKQTGMLDYRRDVLPLMLRYFSDSHPLTAYVYHWS